ncbi:MAG: DUF1559 domain-containing protein [Planctomycetaceae bacterium]
MAGTVIAVLVSLLLPALHSARNAARMVQCRNNLSQLGIAIYNYEAATGVYPPGTVNPPGPIFNEPQGYHMGWLVQLLPALEQGSLYNGMDPRFGVYEAENAALAGASIASMHCPISNRSSIGGFWSTSYAAVTGGSDVPISMTNDGLFFLNSSTSMKQIRDGASNTIMLGERQQNSVPNGIDLGWSSGTAASLRNTGVPMNSSAGMDTFGEDGDGTGGFGSQHGPGAMFLFADGSVTFLSEKIDAATFSNLGTRDSGRDVAGIKFRSGDGF